MHLFNLHLYNLSVSVVAEFLIFISRFYLTFSLVYNGGYKKSREGKGILCDKAEYMWQE